MTIDDYMAYVREYHHRILDACILARAALADPTPEEMELLSEDEDPLEEQAFAFALSSHDKSLALSDVETFRQRSAGFDSPFRPFVECPGSASTRLSQQKGREA